MGEEGLTLKEAQRIHEERQDTMESVKEKIVLLTPDNFQVEVLECDRPVLVTFFALWDQPCRMQQSELDSIADKHPEIKVCKLDVEEYPDFTRQFGIMMVPTTVAFKNGKKIKRASGLRLEHILLSMVRD